MSDEQECEECEAGAPAWLATFADLMSLLMCFFVLLLSFSQMDLRKFKQVAGSVSMAFGVQKTIKSDGIPKGTSVIKQEFSPGKADPSPLKIVQQQTEMNTRDDLRVNDSLSPAIEQMLQALEKTMSEEIEADIMEVVVEDNWIMIRIEDHSAFEPGSADLQESFLITLDRLQSVFSQSNGQIVVNGHTDSRPIQNFMFPSNWVLSAARAASVVHYLSEVRETNADRFEIRAFSDTQPLEPNNTAANRARNRRIEININPGEG